MGKHYIKLPSKCCFYCAYGSLRSGEKIYCKNRDSDYHGFLMYKKRICDHFNEEKEGELPWT